VGGEEREISDCDLVYKEKEFIDFPIFSATDLYLTAKNESI
jgi:hypothetical protein